MNILILCQKYSLDVKQSWLTDGLARELSKDHKVSVVFLDWTGQVETDFYKNIAGVDIHVYATKNKLASGRLGKILKWFIFPKIIVSKVLKDLAGIKLDLVINFSPALIMNPILNAYKKRGVQSYLVLWDFFPLYDSEFNLIPKPIKAVLKRIENYAYNRCDYIGAMSPKNVEFLKQNYSLLPENRLGVLSVWGPNDVLYRSAESYRAARTAQGFTDELVCVFGGQLVRGRGVNKVIELAQFAKAQEIPAVFYIFGDGPERENILLEVKHLGIQDMIVYMGMKPRDEYLQFVSSADIGLVFNSGAAEVPTFPSKSIDYLRAGVPILAYVEDASDFGVFLETRMRAGWSASPRNEQQLFQRFREVALMKADELLARGANGQQYYLQHMTVEIAAKQISSTYETNV
ncbi:glycosyltransferase family 4 protein [Pseudomonas sp. NA-150]|uniref:glycosyltransferase family 4 protein n=1 Tax=Pseudomonas sp. NA-150 TaxID=3367525 RepID=UPI0037C58E75